jgi:hypothetical protein
MTLASFEGEIIITSLEKPVNVPSVPNFPQSYMRIL